MTDIIEECPKNEVIVDNIALAYSHVNSFKYDTIVCSVSGGADSDVMLDIINRVDKEKRVYYIFFDTGLEYQATKEHLKYLEEKYKIKIHKFKAEKPIPTCCKIYGQPFMSKMVSEFMQRLQKHDFQWEDEPYEILIERYPKCKSALEWWCGEKGEKSRFNIPKSLKAFIIQNPPQFEISNKCCTFAKKKTAQRANELYGVDLVITGVRKAEGGIRSVAYKNCFTYKEDAPNEYRPLFWYKDSDREEYQKHFNIVNSKCYTEYGLDRTGCAGCPYGRNFEFELEVIKRYEPKLYKAVINIFRDSYEYTRKYREFVKKMKSE